MTFWFSLIVLIRIYYSLKSELNPTLEKLLNLIVLAFNFSVISALIYSYRSMVFLLKGYHSQHYEDIKSGLKFFFILELTSLVIYNTFLGIFSVYMFHIFTDFDADIMGYITNIEILWISFYPLLQAFGMIFLKESSDPLQGISIVSMMIVVSRN